MVNEVDRYVQTVQQMPSEYNKNLNLARFIVSLIILSVQHSSAMHSTHPWSVSSLVQSLSFNFVQLLV